MSTPEISNCAGKSVDRKTVSVSTSVLTSRAAASLLVFSLLYSPCIAAIASVKRELGAKWAIGMVVWQCAVAWLCALIVYVI